MAPYSQGPFSFEDIAPGDRWMSPARTITETDLVNFAGLTGDFDPLHVDHEFARHSPFRRPIAHGLLGLSLVAGLGSHSPWMRTAAFVTIIDWQFLRPVFIGDTLHVVTEVLAKQAPSRRRGAVVWRRQLVNQDRETAQEGRFETLVLLAEDVRGGEARGDQAPVSNASTAHPLMLDTGR